MIEELEAFAARIDGLPAAVRKEFERLVKDGAGLLLDINRDYIRQKGEAVDGQTIQPGGYSASYAKFKAKYGTRSRNTAYVDLTLTGAFLDSLELQQVDSLEYLVVATDAKYEFLQKYGDLLGIREVDLDDFVSSILNPEIDAYVGRYFD